MSEQQLYRRSMRHMSVGTLRELISAELAELHDTIIETSRKVSSFADNSMTPEQLALCMELVAPACPSMLIINEILATIQRATKDGEESLCEQVADAERTRQEIFDTVADLKNSVLTSVISSFNKIQSETVSLFLECKTLLENNSCHLDDEKWTHDLEKVEQEAIECYNAVKSWSSGKVPYDIRSAMDQISQDVKTLTARLLQRPDGRPDDDCGTIQSKTSTASSLAARAAVQKAKERLQYLQHSTTQAPLATGHEKKDQRRDNISLLSARESETQYQAVNSHCVSGNSERNTGDVATAIAKAIADSMALTRVPTAKPFVFYGDPLQYSDWAINFSAAFDKNGVSDMEKMSHLQSFVGGKAKQAIIRFFRQSTPNALAEARALLKKRFGNDLAISDAYRTELQNWPKIAGKDTEALIEFSDLLQQCLSAMTDIPDLESLNDRSENKKMVDKLPEWLANRWKRKVNSYRNERQTYPKLRTFAKFITEEAEIAAEEVTTERAQKPTSKLNSYQKPVNKRSTALKTQATEKVESKQPVKSNKYCHHCEMSNHDTVECGILAKKSYEEALQMVKDKHLCFRCLRTGHSWKNCQERATCKRCQKRHPTCLHQELGPTNATTTTTTTTKPTESDGNNVTATAICGKVMSSVTNTVFTSSMVVPVWVSHKDKPDREVLAYALLDTQSNASFILDQACDTLKCPTVPTNLQLTTMTSANTTIDCRKVHDLLVRGLRDDRRVELPTCYTRQDIPIDREHIPTPSKIREWPHLREIGSEMSELLDCEVGLLIGYNCPEALAPIETIVKKGNQPFGVRTSLGWSVVGSTDLRESADAIGVSHRIVTKEVKIGEDIKPVQFQTKSAPKEHVRRELHDIIHLLESDFKDVQTDEQMSQDDIKFISMLEHSVRQEEDGHLSMPLPLKERPKFPDSRPMAEKRLRVLKRKLIRDPSYRAQYTSFMQGLIEKGHAERVTTDNEIGEVWYIPHFGVYHPKKPDKLRVVFDCAARFQENCLNDHLLKGPDQTNTLIGVLLRFRLQPIAITCDIEGMFHQFRVHAKDRDYLRFLWLDEDLNIEEFRMTVHLFGATSSPSCAAFGLRNLADRYSATYPMAAEFIKQSFYVDDGIISVKTPEEAAILVQQARDLCSRGGLRLHKFTSNNRDVLESIPVTERAKDIQDLDLAMDELPTERTLGVKWSIESDNFQFKLNLEDKALTRRGVLSGVASVFDPLGFVAPFVLTGKAILQSCCKEKLTWDDPLPEHLKKAWSTWQNSLQDLTQVNIPRCVTNAELSGEVTTQLHHFGDASTNGYGACTYLRQIDNSGKIHCSFLMGKARVAPLKTITMPRMELQAALTAVKISRLLRQEFKFDADVKEYFWTDSKVVLGYIQNDARRFHVYVANRVQQIRDSTEVSQWNYVPSEDNPADSASRGLAAAELSNSTWLCGPRFLWQDRLPLGQGTQDLTLDPTDCEVKICLQTTIQTTNYTHSEVLDTLLCKISSLPKAISQTTTLLKAVSRFRNMKETDTELQQKAMKKIFTQCQRKAFYEEIHTLSTGKQLPDQSKLAKLDAFVDSDGMLRVGGRLKRSSLSESEKHPLILPNQSHLTKLIITDCHKKTGHSGRTFTMSKVREEGFWIINLNKAVTSLIHSCVICRRLRASTGVQKMAELPKDRTEPSPPFLVSACDVFGPFIIKERRKELKYYGLLFTCMASRAVHIEVLTDLSTDSFINAFRCIVALRGPIRRLYCDRGTNFVGAKNELTQTLKEMDKDLQAALLQHQCEFIFNTPSASHMGGVWERQIRTVRNVLQGVILETRPTLNANLFRTLLYEVSAIVNSRPLAVEGLSDSTTPSALTPNHLLTQKTNVLLPPPGNFTDPDLYTRKQWRRVQYLADLFWKRWRKEYLAKQQVRQKWNTVKPNFQDGDVVLLQDSNDLRGEWRLARVTQVHPSKDGLVRHVTLLLGDKGSGKDKTYIQRPISKIKLLLTTNTRK